MKKINSYSYSPLLLAWAFLNVAQFSSITFSLFIFDKPSCDTLECKHQFEFFIQSHNLVVSGKEDEGGPIFLYLL